MRGLVAAVTVVLAYLLVGVHAQTTVDPTLAGTATLEVSPTLDPTAAATPSPSPTSAGDEIAPIIRSLGDRSPVVVLGSRTELATIRFSLSEPADVTVRIVRSDGSRVIPLIQDRRIGAGEVRSRWAGGTRRGRIVRPGRYFYEISATDSTGNRAKVLRGTVKARAGDYRASAVRRYTYTVENRVSRREMSAFRRTASETLADVRGWSLRWNIHYRRVVTGGDFSLILASPGSVAAASSSCSAYWSCRVGNQVLINVDRWRGTTPTWPGSRPAYRSYVINHEVGHWLGLGHDYCSGAGAAAPVMQQQSKGLLGCRSNVWPLGYERSRVASIHGSSSWPQAPLASPCTIVGTDGPDRLRGTPESDVICGFGHRDRIAGGSGPDVLRGGSGKDRLLGGGGFDAMPGAADDEASDRVGQKR